MSGETDGNFREVFLQYGSAMYLANVLEVRLRNILASAQILIESNPTWERFDELLVANQKGTMGNLVQKLKPFPLSDAGLKEDLDITLVIRNRLAHDFFREHYMNFLSVSGRDRMLTELISARDSFNSMRVRTDGAWEALLEDSWCDFSSGSERESCCRIGRTYPT